MLTKTEIIMHYRNKICFCACYVCGAAGLQCLRFLGLRELPQGGRGCVCEEVHWRKGDAA